MQRSDGPAIRDTVDLARRADPRRRGRRRLVLGHLVVRAVLLRLWRALRLVDRFALARMRPRHRLQDAVDERRGLPDRLLHDHAQSGDLALEPHAPPHRHHHRRPRPRDRRDAPAGPAAGRPRLLRRARRLARDVATCCATPPATSAPAEKTFIPEKEQPQGDPRRPHLARRSMPRRSRWRSYCGSFLPLMLVGLPRLYGAWHMVMIRPAAAWRAGRKRRSTTGSTAAPST